MNATNATFDAALASFVVELQAIMDRTYVTPKREVALEGGRKYVRVVTSKAGVPLSKSVYCFVDKATGAILKPDSYKAPAAGVRGSIFSDIRCCGPYGVAYLK